jgi:DNA-binding NarL/FixJ family response regulator
MESDTHTRATIVVAHPEPLIVAGVLHALHREPGLALVHAERGEAAAQGDVVITDQRAGLRLAKEWEGRLPPWGQRPSRLMVVESQAREFEVRQALEAGVRGYVLASCPTDELVNCVNALVRGSRYLSATVAQRMADSMSREALTPREADVLDLLVEGQCNKVIAQSLAIAVGTVKAHGKAIREKLGARSRTHAVAIAAARGLVREGRGGEDPAALRARDFSVRARITAAAGAQVTPR